MVGFNKKSLFKSLFIIIIIAIALVGLADIANHIYGASININYVNIEDATFLAIIGLGAIILIGFIYLNFGGGTLGFDSYNESTLKALADFLSNSLSSCLGNILSAIFVIKFLNKYL